MLITCTLSKYKGQGGINWALNRIDGVKVKLRQIWEENGK